MSSGEQLIEIPSVTEYDLKGFHHAHFPDSSRSSSFPTFALSIHQLNDQDDLGYYPDGTKCTLTKEQIEIFRHSEIQALLKERQAALEEQSSSSAASARSPPFLKPPRSESGYSISHDAAAAKTHIAEGSSKVMRVEKSNRSAGRKKRKRQQYSNLSSSNADRHDPDDYKDGGDGVDGRTHRRKARELDEQKIAEVELDY